MQFVSEGSSGNQRVWDFSVSVNHVVDAFRLFLCVENVADLFLFALKKKLPS